MLLASTAPLGVIYPLSSFTIPNSINVSKTRAPKLAAAQIQIHVLFLRFSTLVVLLDLLQMKMKQNPAKKPIKSRHQAGAPQSKPTTAHVIIIVMRCVTTKQQPRIPANPTHWCAVVRVGAWHTPSLNKQYSRVMLCYA